MGDAPQYSMGSTKRFGKSGDPKDPGPGHFPQVSTRTGGTVALGDGPKYGFGTAAQRQPAEGKGSQYISKEHALKSGFGKGSPGPANYAMATGLGEPSVGASQPNSPRYTMRPKLANYQSMTGSASRNGDARLD